MEVDIEKARGATGSATSPSQTSNGLGTSKSGAGLSTSKSGAGLSTSKSGASEQRHKSWLTNPRTFFRHPLARIWVACQIGVFDFLIYGEDPANDSHVECNLPGVGHIVHFMLRWPESPAFIALRFFLLFIFLCGGLYVGREFLHHWLLRDRWKLQMFDGDKGTFLPMGISFAIAMFLGSVVYNALLPAGEKPVTGALGIEMRTFGKITQCFSWNADLFSILMITDAVLQDRHYWGDWAPSFKKCYCEAAGGNVRVIVMFIIAVVASAVPMAGIFSTGKEQGAVRWDNRDVGGFSEVTRTLFGSLIVFCDLFTVVQDWEFPAFEPSLETEFPVYILFSWKTQISWRWCSCFEKFIDSLHEGCLKRVLPSRDFFHVVITGPWLSYGPLLCVMCVDLLCIKNQALYAPNLYGQYVDPNTNRIWTIIDRDYLALAYNEGVLAEPEMVTWEARRGRPEGLDNSTLTDVELNARYTSAPWSFLGGLPALAMMIVFVVLVRHGNLDRLLSAQNALESIQDAFESVVREFLTDDDDKKDGQKDGSADDQKDGSDRPANLGDVNSADARDGEKVQNDHSVEQTQFGKDVVWPAQNGSDNGDIANGADRMNGSSVFPCLSKKRLPSNTQKDSGWSGFCCHCSTVERHEANEP